MFAQAGEERRDREAPLAARMRPRKLDDFIGQEHLVGEGHILRRLMLTDSLPSIILWGPPGTGKTTLASIIAELTDSEFALVSAVSAGVADLRRIIGEAQDRRGMDGRPTILFIDEIHRFNKNQQDAVLPFVENGTDDADRRDDGEPKSFEVIGPLLSRCRVFALQALERETDRVAAPPRDQRTRSVACPRKKARATSTFDDEAIEALSESVGGDARDRAERDRDGGRKRAPSPTKGPRRVTREQIEEALQARTYLYDKSGDAHYDTISAFIKSGARLGRGRGALLARAHDRVGRGPALHRAPDGAAGRRGRWDGRPAGARDRDGVPAGGALHRAAGGLPANGRDGNLSGDGTQEQQRDDIVRRGR